jgi:hypothetical protein
MPVCMLTEILTRVSIMVVGVEFVRPGMRVRVA